LSEQKVIDGWILISVFGTIITETVVDFVEIGPDLSVRDILYEPALVRLNLHMMMLFLISAKYSSTPVVLQ
jgi:hypothetical protein